MKKKNPKDTNTNQQSPAKRAKGTTKTRDKNNKKTKKK